MFTLTPLNTTFLACALLTPLAAAAQDAYPSKPIRMVVAFAPGGSADINARAIGQQLGKDLDGTIVVENKGACRSRASLSGNGVGISAGQTGRTFGT